MTRGENKYRPSPRVEPEPGPTTFLSSTGKAAVVLASGRGYQITPQGWRRLPDEITKHITGGQP